MTEPLWVIDSESADRSDGVEVRAEPGKVHRGRRWFFVRRPWATPELKAKAARYGRTFHYLTTDRGNERNFSSVDAAVKAARKDWPPMDIAEVERLQKKFMGMA